MQGLKLYSFPVFLLILLAGSIFTFKNSIITAAEELKCLKCHKGKDSLEKYVQEGKVKSAEDLRDLVRKGPKAGLHITSTDEDLEKAIRYLNLK